MQQQRRRTERRRRVPVYLMTRTLEDGARHASRPERFIMLLAVPVEDRMTVEGEALALMFRYGGSYTETLRGVVTRYLATNREDGRVDAELQDAERRREHTARFVMEARRRDSERWGGCQRCLDVDGPRHEGSGRCESGAIAAGGDRAHCTCDVCY